MQTLAFKVAAAPNASQAQLLSSHIGAVRFAYNWAISHVTDNWQAVKRDPSLDYVSTHAFALQAALREARDEVAPWWQENGKSAFNTGCVSASIALRNWVKDRKTGKGVGFPRYKSRHRDSGTGVTFTVEPKRLESDAKHFVLPRIGAVKLQERLSVVQSLIKQGATIGNVTVSYLQERWWISINLRVEDGVALKYFSQKHKRKGSKKTGLDVGLKVFLTDSVGSTVENPAFLRKSLARLRKANKRLSRRQSGNRQTGEMNSNRWERARVQLAKTHAHTANQRKDFLHKLSTKVVLENELIGIETLGIQGLARNRTLSLSISDAGWGEFKRQLHYKSKWYGAKVIEVDRFYPSSKTCSECGAVKAKLSLSERTYECEQCGLVLDRDYNAALNIKKEAIRLDELSVAQSCGETVNGRGDGSSGSVLASGETTVSEASSSTQVLQPA